MCQAANHVGTSARYRRASRACAGTVGVILTSVLVGLLSGCGRDGSASTAHQGDVCRVLVSIAPHAWLVRQIGGEHVQVTTLVQPGESPHTYQPSDAQISAAIRCELYCRTGVPFENGPWLEVMASARGGPRVMDLREGVALRPIEAHGHDDGGNDHPHGPARHPSKVEALDPHIWLSPHPLITQAHTIAAALSDLLPQHAEAFAANLAAFTQAVHDADTRIAALLGPHAGRRFYIFHPAWGYFADAYDLVQIPVEIEGKEPTEHELTELQRQARADGARVIFVQPQIAGRTATALAAAIAGRVEVLDPLAEDVLANLLHAADVLAASFAEAQPVFDMHEERRHE